MQYYPKCLYFVQALRTVLHLPINLLLLHDVIYKTNICLYIPSDEVLDRLEFKIFVHEKWLQWQTLFLERLEKLWKKEKMLVTSTCIFFSSLTMFLETCFSNVIKPFSWSLDCKQFQKRSLLKTYWEKETIQVTSIFSLSHKTFSLLAKHTSRFESHLFFSFCLIKGLFAQTIYLHLSIVV